MHFPSDLSNPKLDPHDHSAPPYRISVPLGAIGGSGTDIDGCHSNAYCPDALNPIVSSVTSP